MKLVSILKCVPKAFRLLLAPLKDFIVNTCNNIYLQIKYPGLHCHYSCELTICGGLVLYGPVYLGKRVRIIVPDGCNLTFGGSNFILNDVLLGPAETMLIGQGTSVQEGCILLGNILIGSHCLLAPRVFASSGHHSFRGEESISAFHLIKVQDKIVKRRDRPITIEADCWLGINSTILPGVKISKGSIVGACSLLRGRYLREYQILGGSPARPLGTRYTNYQYQIRCGGEVDNT